MFNIGSDQPHTVNHLAQKVAEAMGVKAEVILLPPRNEVSIAFSDHSACKELFGPIQQMSLEEALRRMAAWVKMVGSRESKGFEHIEIMKSLPPSWKSKNRK